MLEPKPQRKSLLKILFLIFVSCLFCGIILLASLPTILSTPWGNSKIIDSINSQIAGKISFEHLQISWFGEQQLKDAKLFDSLGQQIASLDKATVNKTSLWELIRNEGKYGLYELDGLNAHIARESDGQTNIQHALSRQEVHKSDQRTQQLLAASVALQEVNVSAHLNDKESSKFQLYGKTIFGSQQGSIDLNLSIHDIFNHQPTFNIEQLNQMQIRANIRNFPVSLLDEVVTLSKPELRNSLLSLLGEKLDLTIQGSKGAESFDFTGELNSPTAHAKIVGSFDKDHKLLLTSPAIIHYTLQPAALDILGMNPLKLNNSMQIQMVVDQDSKGIDLNDISSLQLKGMLHIDQIKLSNPTAVLQKLTLPWEVNAPDNRITLQMNGLTKLNSGVEGTLEGLLQISKWIKAGKPNFYQSSVNFALNGRSEKEYNSLLPFAIKGHLDNIFDTSGRFNTDDLAFILDAKIHQFPVKFLRQFLSQESKIPQQISAILGSTFNTEIKLQMDHLEGPIFANFSGNNGSISLDANIHNGVLTLNKNLSAQVKLTQEFSQVILDDIFPLAQGLIGADNPLLIHVSANGFAMPIKNLNLNSVIIPSASLELGKVHFRNDGQIGLILSLFNVSNRSVIPVEFTPLYFSLQNGTFAFQRMDMLVMDSYPIATWGFVNLPADKVNMVIGLTSQALRKAFNIQNLSKDYVLQIPYKGSIDNAVIDRKNVTAKIAALVAANHGPEGLLIGTALHLASGGLTEEKAPPPTTNPLPWNLEEKLVEKEDAIQEVPQPETKPKDKEKKKRPLKKLEDKATSILQNLLPF